MDSEIGQRESAMVRRVCGALCCVLLLLAPARFVVADEIIDRVLAVVAGDLIMLSDVKAAEGLHLLAVASGGDPIREILPRLIDRALILSEVERYVPPEPDAESVNRQVQAVRATFATAQAFDVALARVGFDERRLRETLRQDLRIRAYLDQRFTVQPPGDDELGRYYREHPEMFSDRGTLMPFALARPRVLEAATAQRRRTLVDEWVAGLRRRAQILDLSEMLTREPTPRP